VIWLIVGLVVIGGIYFYEKSRQRIHQGFEEAGIFADPPGAEYILMFYRPSYRVEDPADRGGPT